jgi:ABC-type transport system involved in multi-copper enzyme maturation permease subunit
MSPVHDQSYRRYGGTRRSPGGAWLVIARTGIRAMLSRRVFIGLLALSWIPFLVRTVQIYAVTTYPQARQVLPIDVRLFERFVEGQGLFAFFITVYVGAGLIANDRRANALQVYLSKPIARLEYIGGKLAILMTYLAFATLVPSLLLIVMQLVFSGSFDFVRENPSLIPAVTVASLLRIIVGSITMLALSSVSRSTRYVAVLYTGVIFFAEAIYAVLRVAMGTTRVAWISLSRNFSVVNDALFDQSARYDAPVLVCAIVLAALIAVSVSVLERTIRGVEIVK